MAGRAGPLMIGISAAALVAALILGPLAVLVWQAGHLVALSAADWAALRFTVLQAALSALVAVAAAVPVARALARRRFRGRAVLITLLGAPFMLPVVVAVLGLIAVFGRAGLLNGALRGLGLPEVQIYGLQGVLLAHVFFNLPLATRLLLQGWQSIPAEHFRLAAQLGFARADLFWHLERPMLTERVPGILLAIFLLCITSFAVALTLGGGPGASTMELAIYQAFRFEFDLAHMATLALVQLGVTALATFAALRFTLPAGMGAGMGAGLDGPRMAVQGAGLRDGVVLALVTVFLLLPLVMVLATGVPHLLALPETVWWSALLSLGVAACATAVALGLGLALGTAALRFAAFEGLGMLALTASPLVIGVGLVLVLRPVVEPGLVALPITVLVNATMALPLVLRSLMPGLRAAEADFGRLGDHLNLQGMARLRLLTLPRLRRPLGFAAGVTAALSMGDLGVIALFSDPDRTTLPMQVFQLMGAYRTDLAAGAALLLAGISLGLFWLCDQWGRHAEV